jgi:3-oxoacyl-[acyl-carrier-protein] synthase II
MSTHQDKFGRPLIAVTGIGLITSLGKGKDINWAGWMSG